MLATGCQNLGRLNRKLSEVLVLILSFGCLCSVSLPRGAVGWSVICVAVFLNHTRLYMLLVYSKICLKLSKVKSGTKSNYTASEIPESSMYTFYRLMKVKSIAECSKGCILQYFRPSLSYHLSLRSLFCLFLSDRLRQILCYLMTILLLIRAIDTCNSG